MMKIFWLEIEPISSTKLFTTLTETIENPQKEMISVFTPNPEICLKTRTDTEFENMLSQADILTNDGMGLYLAYQLNDSKLPKIAKTAMLPYYLGNIIFRKKALYSQYGDRICGSDLTRDLVNYAQDNSIKIAIIDRYNPDDAWKVTSQKVFSEKLSQAFPELRFDFYIFDPDEAEEIYDQIAHSDAKILFSTLGMKSQEASILQAKESCPNIRLGLGVGSAFDYFTGFQKRAPEMMRRAGFEWLYRIFTSPNKLARLKRIYEATVVFPLTVIFHKS